VTLWARCASVLVLVFLGLWGLLLEGFRVNTSPSVPRGVYRLERIPAVATGELVLACVPAGRKTAPSWMDQCPEGLHPAYKYVAARAGTCVEIDDEGALWIGEEFVMYLPEDVPFAYTEAHCLEAGDVWLHTGHPKSWDSRFYGPVPERWILARARPVQTLSQDDVHVARIGARGTP